MISWTALAVIFNVVNFDLWISLFHLIRLVMDINQMLRAIYEVMQFKLHLSSWSQFFHCFWLYSLKMSWWRLLLSQCCFLVEGSKLFSFHYLFIFCISNIIGNWTSRCLRVLSFCNQNKETLCGFMLICIRNYKFSKQIFLLCPSGI